MNFKYLIIIQINKANKKNNNNKKLESKNIVINYIKILKLLLK